VGDLRIFVSFQVVQHDDFSLLDRELAQNGFQLDRLRQFGRARIGKFTGFFEGELEALAPQCLKELPVRDLVEPGPKRRALPKGVQTAPGLEERFLGQVLRRLRAPREIQQIPVDAGVVLLHELAARVGIPAPDPLDEQGVRGRGRLRLLCSLERAVVQGHVRRLPVT
jgi:hypothetical protein